MTSAQSMAECFGGALLERTEAGDDGRATGTGQGDKVDAGARCFIDTVNSFPGSNECRAA